MYGQGLLKGLKVTFKHMFGKAITEQYPERRPQLAPRFHGLLELNVDECDACSTCFNWCPNDALKVESKRGEDKKRELVSHTLDLGLCLFCGLCVEGCPQNALRFNQEFEHACYDRRKTLYDLKARAEAKKMKNAGPQEMAAGLN